MADDTTAIAKPSTLGRWLTETRDILDKLGVPENAARCVPAIAVLFGVTGLPAAGIVVTSLLGAGVYAAWKQHSFQQAIRQELHGAVGDVEAEVKDVEQAVDDLRESIEDVRAEAQDMASKLSPEQLEQLGTIFEQYMASLSVDWLTHLRQAIRGVVRDDIKGATRKAVLAHLRLLGPEHVLGLRRLAEAGGVTGLVTTASVDLANQQEVELTTEDVEHILLSTGFIQTPPNPGGMYLEVTGHPPRTYRVTSTGVAALALLGGNE